MIYIHVPFCRSFCTYCGFYSEIAEDSLVSGWADAVKREALRRKDEITDNPSTLYIGGGTPSVLPLDIVADLLSTLAEAGHGGPFSEFTIEVNPEDVVEKGERYIQGLLALGVNRVSMGVQSFSDPLLRWMNRRHNSQRAVRAIGILRDAGVSNLSLDLIFGLSSLTAGTWRETVEKALSFRPEHISCYQLGIDEGSALCEMASKGLYREASDEDCRSQYDILCDALAREGYRHYEISNFALPGYESIHNSAYWQRVPYVGLGPSAHSFDGKVRSWNTSEVPDYHTESECLSAKEATEETIMLSLRTDKGADGAWLHDNCSTAVLDSLLREGCLQRTGDRIRIPEDHFFVSDDIIGQLI